MLFVIAFLLCVSTSHASDQSVARSVIQRAYQEAQKAEGDVRDILGMTSSLKTPNADCASCQVSKDGFSSQMYEAFQERLHNSEEEELLVFVSFSMGHQNLKSLLEQVRFHRLKGRKVRAVLRGLYENSWQKTQKRLLELQETLQIDPVAFEEHRIERVPTFVRLIGQHKDRLGGNVSLNYVLETFESGETS